jgi:hypothetical protein
VNAQGWSLIIGATGTALAAIIAAAMPYLIRRISKVHDLVNSQHDALVVYIGVLTTAMSVAGIEIPQPAKAAVAAEAVPEAPQVTTSIDSPMGRQSSGH